MNCIASSSVNVASRLHETELDCLAQDGGDVQATTVISNVDDDLGALAPNSDADGASHRLAQ